MKINDKIDKLFYKFRDYCTVWDSSDAIDVINESVQPSYDLQDERKDTNEYICTDSVLSTQKESFLKLVLTRDHLLETYTIGTLYVERNGVRTKICDTLEDKVRDINRNGVFDGMEKKVYGQTAIPYGIYEIDMNSISPKFQYKSWGLRYSGIVPLIRNVSEFEGVRIHPFNTASESLGCIGVGVNDSVGRISRSTETYYRLMDEYLIPAKRNRIPVFLYIV